LLQDLNNIIWLVVTILQSFAYMISPVDTTGTFSTGKLVIGGQYPRFIFKTINQDLQDCGEKSSRNEVGYRSRAAFK
jgi:hypothetical protein